MCISGFSEAGLSRCLNLFMPTIAENHKKKSPSSSPTQNAHTKKFIKKNLDPLFLSLL